MVRELPTPSGKPAVAVEQTLPVGTDAARAKRFVDRFQEDVRFCPERGVWLVWDNGWRFDRDGGIQRLAVELSREAFAAVGVIPGTDKAAANAREAAAREAAALADGRNIRDYLDLAAVDQRVLVSADSLDGDEFVIGFGNGILDLRDGTFRDFKRSDLVTKRMGSGFDPLAKCPRWRKFLEEILPDPAVRRFVLKAAGATLTGAAGEHCYFFLWGGGANGKSTFVETLFRAFGSYAVRAGRGIIDAGRHGEYPLREMADLAGARLAVASETEEGSRLNESVIKDLTGGDRVRAERKYEHSFEFVPKLKLWLCGNHRPAVRGTDFGIWRRVRLIPFTQKFDGATRDARLPEILKAELPGIYNWLLSGYRAWEAEGLEPLPDAVRLALDEYRNECDTLADFIDEVIVEAPGASVGHKGMFAAYRSWASGAGVRWPLSSRILAKRLRERGFHDVRTSAEKVVWTGVSMSKVTETGIFP